MEFSFDEWFRLLSTENDVAAEKYRASFMPDYVYKFVSLFDEKTDDDKMRNQKRLASLAKNKVWFSHRTVLNDPYEMKGFYFDKELLLSKGVPKEIVDSFLHFYQSMPIASFTENIAQNLPMWAHYSNNHRGYAVKYKVNNKRMLRAVLYQSEIEDFTNKFLYFLHSIFASKETHNLETIKAAHFYSSVFLFIPFTKHQSWKYEKEYRMIYPEIITESGLNVETSNLGIEPTSVYAGIKCSEEHKERLQQITNTLGIEFHCCKQSDRYFTVIE